MKLAATAIVAENISEIELQYLDPLTGRHVVELDAIDQAWRLNYRRVILIRPALPVNR